MKRVPLYHGRMHDGPRLPKTVVEAADRDRGDAGDSAASGDGLRLIDEEMRKMLSDADRRRIEKAAAARLAAFQRDIEQLIKEDLKRNPTRVWRWDV